MEEKKVEKKIEQPAAKQRSWQRSRRTVAFSNPFVAREVELDTTPAQLVYEQSFVECDAAMRKLSALMPIFIQNQSDAMVVNGVVNHLTNTVMAEIRAEVARINRVAEDNGIGIERLGYSNSMRYAAQLTCSKASVYLQIILNLDELVCLVHAAWFAGFIADEEKLALENKWRKKVFAVSSEIKTISDRAFVPSFLAAFCAKHNPHGVGAASPDAAQSVEEKPTATTKAKRAKPTSTADAVEQLSVAASKVGAEAVAAL